MSISACTFVTRAVREMFTTRTAKTDLRKQIKKVLNDLPLHEKKRQSETVIKKVNLNRLIKSAAIKEIVAVVQSATI